MKKIVLVFLSLPILALIIVFPKNGAAKPVPAIDIEVDRPFYSTTETVSIKISLSGPVDNVARRSRVQLRVFDRVPPESGLVRVKTRNNRSIFRQTWFEEISTDTKELEFKKDLSQVAIGEGVYPVEVSLDLKKGKQIKNKIFLVIMNQRTEQLPVILVWDWHHLPQRAPGGFFIDNALMERIGKVDEPGIYFDYVAAIKNSPNVKINLAISPSLLGEIQKIADGFQLKSSNKLKNYGPDSPQSQAAKKLINDLRDISGNKDRTEILSVPFGYPHLPAILDAGWESDFKKHVKKGKNTLKTILRTQTASDTWLAPGLELDENSASGLANSGAGKVVLDGDFFQKRPKNFFGGPYEIGGGKALTGYVADPEFTYMISKIKKDKIKNWLHALIAMRLLAAGDEKNYEIAVIGAGENEPVDLDTINAVFDVFGANPWVRTENIGKITPPLAKKTGGFVDEKSEPFFDLRHFTDLTRIRREVLDFSQTVSSDNPLRKSLEENLLKAQSHSFLREDGFSDAKAGADFLKETEQSIDEAYGRIQIAATQTITFSGNKGKIPIAITNRNDYPVTLTLNLEGGKDFSFSDDKKSVVKIMPKENLLVHQVTANFRGTRTIKIGLSAGSREVTGAQIKVAVSDMAKNVLNVVSLISLLLAALVILRSRIRGRNV